MSRVERKKERFAAKKAMKRLQRKERKASQTEQNARSPRCEGQSVPTRLREVEDTSRENRVVKSERTKKRKNRKISDMDSFRATESDNVIPHAKNSSIPIAEPQNGKLSRQAARTSSAPHERATLTMELISTAEKHTDATVGAHKSVQSPNPGSAPYNDAKTQGQLDYESEEEYEKEPDRLLTITLAKGGASYEYGTYAARQSSGVCQSGVNTCAHKDAASSSPEHDTNPDITSAFNGAFTFICDMQHEQYELDAKVRHIEAEIKAIRNKVFKLDRRDYWKIKQLEKLIDLSLALNHELFIAEYAFRDVLDTSAADEAFDLGGELAKLQEEAVDMFRGYDAEVVKLREWHTCDAWAEHD
jgi:hypothetical protein